MSPEMELLDQQCGEDESLFFALRIFGWHENSEVLAQARYAIIKQLEEGLIQIKQKTESNERDLPEWEAKQILNDDTNWLKQRGEAAYFIGLTDKGSKYISGDR